MARPHDADDYVLDPFDDGSSKLVGEKLQAKLESFVLEYGTQLRSIEEALDETLSDFWDSTVDPVSLSFQPYEQTKILELVKTDNKLFNKIIIVFASLCVEMRKLREEAERKFFAPFLLFGEESGPAEEGEAQIQIGRLLGGEQPFLLELSNFVNRCYVVVQNVVRQLASLYHPTQKLWVTSFKPVRLLTVYEHLADLLGALISLDQIIGNNEAFRHSWAMYKRMTKSVRSDPARYNADDERLVQFEKLLLSLEGQLLDGLIFQNCIEQEFDFPGLVEVRQNTVFQSDFMSNIKDIYVHLATRLGQRNEGHVRGRYVGLCGLFVFHFTVYRDVGSTKQFFKQLWELHTKVPLVHLCGNVLFQAPEFFIKRIPVLVKTLGSISVTKFRADYVKNFDKAFLGQVQELYLESSVWMVRMESNLTNRADIRDILNTRIALLSQGPMLAYRISNLFKTAVYLHLSVGVPLKKAFIAPLFQCVEMLKAVAATFHRRSAMIGQSILHMADLLHFQLTRALLPVKLRLEGTGKYSDAKLDVLAAVTLAIHMLNGTATPNRLLILRLCMHVLFQTDFIKEDEMEAIKLHMHKLEGLVLLSQRIKQACECAFLYWNRNMIPIHLKDIYLTPEHAHKLHYLFAALPDILPVFRHAVFKDQTALSSSLGNEIYDSFQQNMLDRLCRDIETDLRLHIHSHLAVTERDPWKTGLPNLRALVSLTPLRFFGRTLNIKSYVEHYLDTTFYNLTTVALYDWQTYGEMRNLASIKYGLDLTEVHLPGQTLEQGLDVLEIMRNIHIFVSKYNYNLNNQIFIEASTPNKTINTISISHIANSIRTHGTGIMNTTVNFTYQFLRQKFVIFSQFLYDDHIKSRLYKDIRFFKETKHTTNSRYPFPQAERFNKEIRKLGLTDKGLSYLDQFRILITEIGNAMGYIRMIRSGGLYYTSNAIKFVPDLQDIVSFHSLAQQETLPAHTKEAARNLDTAINNLVRNFAEGTEYNKMLVNVFATEFRDPRNLHLKNFYAIVPPLALNFVQHILKCKDKLVKKQTDEAIFTDDGFAMGLAYILKLLAQYVEFDGLHWWESVKEHYEAERARLAELARQKGKDKEDQQTLTLTAKKLTAFQTEFELLRFSFNGARIFFKD